MAAIEFTGWRKAAASDSNGGGCVEVGTAPGLRGIRDSTLGESSPVAVASEGTFAALLDAARAGRLDG